MGYTTLIKVRVDLKEHWRDPQKIEKAYSEVRTELEHYFGKSNKIEDLLEDTYDDGFHTHNYGDLLWSNRITITSKIMSIVHSIFQGNNGLEVFEVIFNRVDDEYIEKFDILKIDYQEEKVNEVVKTSLSD